MKVPCWVKRWCTETGHLGKAEITATWRKHWGLKTVSRSFGSFKCSKTGIFSVSIVSRVRPLNPAYYRQAADPDCTRHLNRKIVGVGTLENGRGTNIRFNNLNCSEEVHPSKFLQALWLDLPTISMSLVLRTFEFAMLFQDLLHGRWRWKCLSRWDGGSGRLVTELVIRYLWMYFFLPKYVYFLSLFWASI